MGPGRLPGRATRSNARGIDTPTINRNAGNTTSARVMPSALEG